MTLSAGAIVHSVHLTEFAVTGHYEVHPSIFKNKISTQQSTGNGIRRWPWRGDGIEKWWQLGGIGRRRWAADEDYSGCVGQQRRQKNMPQWHWCHYH